MVLTAVAMLVHCPASARARSAPGLTRPRPASGVLVLAAATVGTPDDALLRPGRLHEQIEVRDCAKGHTHRTRVSRVARPWGAAGARRWAHLPPAIAGPYCEFTPRACRSAMISTRARSQASPLAARAPSSQLRVGRRLCGLSTRPRSHQAWGCATSAGLSVAAQAATNKRSHASSKNL